MRKSVPIALLVVFVFGLIAFAPELEPGKAVPHFVFEKPAKVIRIIDGDTFVARWEAGYQVKIRPASVGASELGQCFSIEATVWVSNFLLNRWVWLSPVEKLWSYDRILAQVYLDSKRTANFGRIMVNQGFAEAMEEYPTGKELQPFEDEAKEAERGMWAACENP